MKFLKAYETKKWLLFGLPILAMCVIMACSKDDGKTDDTTDDITGGTDDDPTPAMTFTDFDPKQGEAGVTTVTLTGTNFSTTPSENKVEFGTVAATVTSTKANQLQVTVPATAQTGTISVTTNGTKVTSTDTFTVEDPQPQMTITGFDPMEGEWGTEVTISGTNFRETTDIVSVGVEEAEIVSRTATEIVIRIPDNSRTAPIIVQDDANNEYVESENDFTVFHGRWTQLDDFEGIARRDATAFSLNGKGYVGLGSNGTITDFRDIWEYDPETGDWTKHFNDFPGDPHSANTGFVINGIAYVGTGLYDGNLYNDFWKYDPESDEWSDATSLTGEPRYFSFGFSMNNKGYVGAGVNQLINLTKDFWEYDPDIDAWTQLSDFGGGLRSNAAHFVINGKAYVGTGQQNNQYFKDIWEFDPQSGNWSQKASFEAIKGIGRTGALGFSLKGKGYLGLGLDAHDNLVRDFWEYDPNNDTWVRIADFPGEARSRASVFIIDGKAYVGLGYDVGSLKDFWVFDPGN